MNFVILCRKVGAVGKKVGNFAKKADLVFTARKKLSFESDIKPIPLYKCEVPKEKAKELMEKSLKGKTPK